MLQMVLKCADIGHLSVDPKTHKRWAFQLEEEFFRQVYCSSHFGTLCNSTSLCIASYFADVLIVTFCATLLILCEPGEEAMLARRILKSKSLVLCWAVLCYAVHCYVELCGALLH